MKNLQKITVILIAFAILGLNAQEKKIKFNKGTLKICSSKNFQIEGYDGDEVIIKSLHDKKTNYTYTVNGDLIGYGYKSGNGKSLSRLGTKKNQSSTSKAWSVDSKLNSVYFSKDDTTIVKGYRGILARTSSDERKKGLKKLGTNSNNYDLGIYFTIEQTNGELLFKDEKQAGFIMSSNERYQIKIPNSLKLQWTTNNCSSRDRTGEYRFFSSSNPSSLSNFNGEVEISSTVNNMELLDVTGPVIVNTIGGNVTIKFDKKYPKNLYSIYSNNGFIDMQIPNKSSLMVDVIGKSVYSDVDFKVLEEEEVNDVWQKTTKMKLKFGAGKTKMKLNAGFGEVFLRKK